MLQNSWSGGRGAGASQGQPPQKIIFWRFVVCVLYRVTRVHTNRQSPRRIGVNIFRIEYPERRVETVCTEHVGDKGRKGKGLHDTEAEIWDKGASRGLALGHVTHALVSS